MSHEGFRRLSLQPLLAGLAAGIIGVLLLLGGINQWRYSQQELVRAEVLHELSRIRARIEGEMNATVHLTSALAAYVSLNPALSMTEFELMAAYLMQRRRHVIRNFTLAPDNIIRYVYPLKGNEAAMGLDLSRHSEQSSSVARAMATQETVLAGPWLLAQGTEALLIRTPIFYRPEAEGADTSAQAVRYWGLASIPLDMPTFYREVGLDTLSVRLAIRGRDGLGEDGAVFFGEARLFEPQAKSLRQRVEFLGGRWELAAEPLPGWTGAVPRYPGWTGPALLLIVMFGLLTWKFFDQTLRIREAGRKYRTLIEHLSDGACIIQDGRLRYVNPRMSVISGYPPSELLDRPLHNLIVESDRNTLSRADLSALSTSQHVVREYELRLRRRDQEPLYVRLNVAGISWEGRPAVLATVTDIDDRTRLLQMLHATTERLHALISALPDVAFVIDEQGCYIESFGGHETLLYQRSRNAYGRYLQDIFPAATAERFMAVIRCALETQSLKTIEYSLRLKPGEPVSSNGHGEDLQWFEGRVVPLHYRQPNDVRLVLWLAFNITQRKHAEDHIRYMALHDNLTGLANRRLFRDCFDKSLLRARHEVSEMALMFLDLDDFKPINDSLGHEAGDKVLQEIARRLKAQLHDEEVAARIGGDEFVVLIQHLPHLQAIEQRAHAIVQALNAPLWLDGHCCQVGVSIGISRYPYHGEDFQSLLQIADEALYLAKAQGKNHFMVAP